MGRLRIIGQENVRAYMADPHHGDPATPHEPNDDGCPGGWYRSAFPFSVMQYERTIQEHSIASNPILDRCDDPLVLEAVAYLEAQRLRHRNHYNAVISGS